MKAINLILIGSLFVFCQCSQTSSVHNIVDYGAVNDTTILSTEVIQKAIDQCAINGGTVLVPPGRYQTGTINLKSNVELHVAEGAELLGSTSINDYSRENTGAIEAPAFDETVVFAENANNIKITGKGIINGRGYKSNFPVKIDEKLADRPMLIRFVECTNVILTDITLKNSASWCTHMVDCDTIVASGVTINSHVNINNDGFDLDGCKEILLENCTIHTGDDAICPKSTTTRLTENMVVRNCRAVSHTSAFKCGTSSRGGFKNITVTDCDFSDTRMGAIKLLLVDGGLMEDITIENIIMNNVEGPVFIRLANRGRKYNTPTEQVYNKEVKSEGVPVGSIKNITIKNIKAKVVSDIQKRCGIMISGIPDHYIENVLLEDIEISYPGGGTEDEAKIVVDEDIARYPEQFFFGVLPSWGAYVRHTKNVEFKNVKMTTRNPDKREEIVLVDVDGFVNE